MIPILDPKFYLFDKIKAKIIEVGDLAILSKSNLKIVF
jgi:hypothetical protein